MVVFYCYSCLCIYITETHVQYEQKENKRKAAEHDQGLDEQHDDPGLEQHGRPNEDVNAVDVFKDFHTSTKKGLSDVVRETVVSTFICFL